MVYVLHAKPVHGHYPSIDWGGGDFPSPKMIEPPSDGMPSIGAGKSGVPVDGSVLPSRIQWMEKPEHPPADFDNMPRMNLSESAKTIIESFEPGIHQFFPVEYFGRDGDKIETRYWLYICNRGDTICPMRSNRVLSEFGEYVPPRRALRRKMEIPSYLDLNAPAKHVVDRSKVGGMHLWRDARVDGLPLMSGGLHNAIVEAGLSGFAPSGPLEVF